MIAVPHYISPKDYLDIEPNNPVRHEYQLGLVYAMADDTDNHDRIALNLLPLVNLHLGDTIVSHYSYSPTPPAKVALS